MCTNLINSKSHSSENVHTKSKTSLYMFTGGS